MLRGLADTDFHHNFHSRTRSFQTPGCETQIVASSGARFGMRLPFGIRTVRHRTYELRQISRSAESAMELAYYQLRCRMEGEIPNGMLMKKSLWTELTDEAYVLRCRAQYVEDIAKVQEIEIEGIP